MVIASQVLNYDYSSNFSHTLDFLRERKSRVPVKTIRVIHFSADNVDFRYGQRAVEALRQLLRAIPKNSLTHLESVYSRA